MIRFDLKGYSRRLSKSNQIVYYVFSEHIMLTCGSGSLNNLTSFSMMPLSAKKVS